MLKYLIRCLWAYGLFCTGTLFGVTVQDYNGALNSYNVQMGHVNELMGQINAANDPMHRANLLDRHAAGIDELGRRAQHTLDLVKGLNIQDKQKHINDWQGAVRSASQGAAQSRQSAQQTRAQKARNDAIDGVVGHWNDHVLPRVDQLYEVLSRLHGEVYQLQGVDSLQYVQKLRQALAKIGEICAVLQEGRGRFVSINYPEGITVADKQLASYNQPRQELQEFLTQAEALARAQRQEQQAKLPILEAILVDEVSEHPHELNNLREAYEGAILNSKILNEWEAVKRHKIAYLLLDLRVLHEDFFRYSGLIEAALEQENPMLEALKHLLEKLQDLHIRSKDAWESLTQVDPGALPGDKNPALKEAKITHYKARLDAHFNPSKLEEPLQKVLDLLYKDGENDIRRFEEEQVQTCLFQLDEFLSIAQSLSYAYDADYWAFQRQVLQCSIQSKQFDLAFESLRTSHFSGEDFLRSGRPTSKLGEGLSGLISLLESIKEYSQATRRPRSFRRSIHQMLQNYSALQEDANFQDLLKTIEREIEQQKLKQFYLHRNNPNQASGTLARSKGFKTQVIGPYAGKLKRLDNSDAEDSDNPHGSFKGFEFLFEDLLKKTDQLLELGSHFGGDALYAGQSYRFIVDAENLYLGDGDLGDNNLRVRVFQKPDLPGDLGEQVYEQYYALPVLPEKATRTLQNPQHKRWGSIYLIEHASRFPLDGRLADRFNLETSVRVTESDSNFFQFSELFAKKQNYRPRLLFSHRGQNTQYIYQIELRDNSGEYNPLYALSFSEDVPESVHFVQRPPLNTGIPITPYSLHQGQSFGIDPVNLELLNTGSLLNTAPSLSSELSQHPLLDAIVKDCDSEALQIIQFVLNEIDLIVDSYSSIEPAGYINRNATGVLLDKAGNAWENTVLLLCLLRRAGYKAAYAQLDGMLSEMKLGDSDLDKLFQADMSGYSKTSRLPWVVYQDPESKAWIHVFPWMKDYELSEGEDLEDWMPGGYKNMEAWINGYLQNDPAIVDYAKQDANDTAWHLFLQHLEDHLRPYNKTLSDMGLQKRLRRQYISSIEDLPTPQSIQGHYRIYDKLVDEEDLFGSVVLEVYSQENPEKKITTAVFPLAQIHHRPLYFYHEPLSNDPNELGYRLVLRLEGEDPQGNLPVGAFQGSFENPQEASLILGTEDKNIRIRSIFYKGKREGEPTYDTDRPVDKGSTAAICLNYGLFSKDRVQYSVDYYNSCKSQLSAERLLGLLCAVMGSAYYEKVTNNDRQIQEMHKQIVSPMYCFGLSKLSSDKTRGSRNMSLDGHLKGPLDLRYPQVDMLFLSLSTPGNGTLHPSSAMPSLLSKRSANLIGIVDGSSWEHQVINTVFHDKHAISTAKLLQLAHKRHVESGKQGAGFITLTQSNIKDFIQGNLPGFENNTKIIQDLGSQWKSIMDALAYDPASQTIDSDTPDAPYAIAYITPGKVHSDDGDIHDVNNPPSYYGSGAFIYQLNQWAALISGNEVFYNGGYGGALPENTFAPQQMHQVDVDYDYDTGAASYDYDTETIDFEKMQAYREFIQDTVSEVRDYYDGSYQDYVQENMDFFESFTGEPVFTNYAQESSFDNHFADNDWNAGSSYSFDSNHETFLFKGDNFRDYLNVHDVHIPDGLFNDFERIFKNREPQQFADPHVSGHEAEYTQATPEQKTNFARQYADEGIQAPELNPESKNLADIISDPVDLSTGAFYLNEQDLRVGRFAPIVFKRSYNSQNTLPTIMGYAWKHNYRNYLTFDEKDGKELLLAPHPEGSTIVYSRVKEKDRLWVVDPDHNQDLPANLASSGIVEYGDSTFTNYRHHLNDGSIFYYNIKKFPLGEYERERPYLSSFSNNLGDKYTFDYHESFEDPGYGEIATIRNEYGDALRFDYNERGYLSRVQANDGRAVHYSYDQHGDLTEVLYPDHSSVHYFYQLHIENQAEEQKNVIYSKHWMIRKEEPENFVLENRYDPQGRVIHQKTRYGFDLETAHHATYVYQDQENGRRTITVKDPLGKLLKYFYLKGKLLRIDDPYGDSLKTAWYWDTGSYLDPGSLSIIGQPELSKADAGASKGKIYYTEDKRGLRSTFRYDERGVVIEKIVSGEDLNGDATLHEIKTEYSYSSGRLPDLKQETHWHDGLAYTTGYEYHRGVPKKVTDSVGGRVQRVLTRSFESYSAKTNYLLEEKLEDANGNLLRRTTFVYHEDSVEEQAWPSADAEAPVVTTHYYNPQGLVRKTITPSGGTIYYRYDQRGRLIQKTHKNADSVFLSGESYFYDARGRLKGTRKDESVDEGSDYTVFHPYTLYRYDYAGNCVAAFHTQDEMADASRNPVFRHHSYKGDFELSDYDLAGNLIRQVDVRGTVTAMDYDAVGRVVKKTTVDRVEDYNYGLGGVLERVDNNWGASPKLYDYSTNKLLIRSEESGRVSSFLYDSQGRLKSHYAGNEDNPIHTEYTYNDLQQRKTTTKKNSESGETLTSVEHYDALGRLVRHKNPAGFISEYRYNLLGDLIWVKDAEGTRQYRYDYTKNSTYENHPKGGYTLTGEDDLGRTTVQGTQDAEGEWIDRSYYYYASNGQMMQIVQGQTDAFHEIISYDTQGNLIYRTPYLEADELRTQKHSQFWHYDAAGNLIRHKNALGNVTIYDYDAYGQLICVHHPDGTETRYTYDLAGNLIELNLPGDLHWKATYDSTTGEQLSEELLYGSASEREYRYELEPATGQLIQVTDPCGVELEYAYDGLGRLKEITTSTGESLSYTYDEAGHVKNLNKRNTAGDEVITMNSYNPAGHLTKQSSLINDELHQSCHQTWASGQRTELHTKIGDVEQTLSFAYDGIGRLIQLKDPRNAYELTATYDTRGKREKLTDNFVEEHFLQRNTYGQPGARRLENPIHWLLMEVMDYDAAGHMSGYQLNHMGNYDPELDGEDAYDSFAKVAAYARYNYAAGRLIEEQSIDVDLYKNQNLVLQHNTRYNYTPSGALENLQETRSRIPRVLWKLREAQGAKPLHRCAADLSEDINDDTFYCLHDTTSDDEIRTYDPAGRLTYLKRLGPEAEAEELHLSWNAFGELTQVESPGHYKWTALYDAYGQRIRTTYTPENGEAVVLDSHYDPEVEFLEIGLSHGHGRTQETIWQVYGPDDRGSYAGKDGIGSLQALIDAQSGAITKPIRNIHGNVIGQIIDREYIPNELEIGPYGRIRGPNTAPPSLEESLAQNENHGEKENLLQLATKTLQWKALRPDVHGHYYLGTRHYDPNIGAFISPDPLGHTATPGLYPYAHGDPINYIDLDGRFASAAWEGTKAGWRESREYVSTGIDFVPVVGNIKSALEATTGKDYIGGHTLSTQERALAAATILIPMGAAGKLGMRSVKTLKGVKISSYANLRKSGLKDAHHIIQDAAVRDIPGYSKNLAPAVQLRGPSTRIGTPHYRATQIQRQAGGGAYYSERRIAYKALRRSGLHKDEARSALREADNYFHSIGVSGETLTRIPGNRR